MERTPGAAGSSLLRRRVGAVGAANRGADAARSDGADYGHQGLGMLRFRRGKRAWVPAVLGQELWGGTLLGCWSFFADAVEAGQILSGGWRHGAGRSGRNYSAGQPVNSSDCGRAQHGSWLLGESEQTGSGAGGGHNGSGLPQSLPGGAAGRLWGSFHEYARRAGHHSGSGLGKRLVSCHHRRRHFLLFPKNLQKPGLFQEHFADICGGSRHGAGR